MKHTRRALICVWKGYITAHETKGPVLRNAPHPYLEFVVAVEAVDEAVVHRVQGTVIISGAAPALVARKRTST